MKALKAFIEPVEVSQRRVKIKFKFVFILIQLSEMYSAGRVKIKLKNISNLRNANE